jgi:methionyl-tRNA formyltransferase
LPQWALDTPKHGCLNIHASLLPRWRGAAPIHRAIEAGDPETGITIMQMDAGLDTGAMLLKQTIPIAADDTTQTLHDKLAVMGGSLIQKALRGYAGLQATPQLAEGVTYAAKISKTESAIDWSQDAAVIERKIRALNPAPGCTTELNGEIVKVWHGAVVDEKLQILELQRPGGKRMAMADYLRGLKKTD